MVMSIDEEKASDKIQHLLMIKKNTLIKLKCELLRPDMEHL